MKTNPIIRVIYILVVLAVILGADQFSKALVRKQIPFYTAKSYLHNHFFIERAENTGAFLSMGDSVSKPVRIILLNVVPLLLVLGALGYVMYKTNLNNTVLVAIILMIGGGLGNIYDRIIHGSVTDFLYIDLGGVFHTGVFNVADLCITVGISIIIIRSWVVRHPAAEEAIVEQPIDNESKAENEN